MDTQKTMKKNQYSRKIFILMGICGALLVINIFILVLLRNQVVTISLLRKEMQTLKQDEQIIKSAVEITANFGDEIKVISAVFPDEESLPGFILELENLLQAKTNEYNLKFTSITPMQEGENLFLPISVTLKTDLGKLLEFFGELESLPFILHITSITSKAPSGISDFNEVNLGVKVYVQNPFSTK